MYRSLRDPLQRRIYTKQTSTVGGLFSAADKSGAAPSWGNSNDPTLSFRSLTEALIRNEDEEIDRFSELTFDTTESVDASTIKGVEQARTTWPVTEEFFWNYTHQMAAFCARTQRSPDYVMAGFFAEMAKLAAGATPGLKVSRLAKAWGKRPISWNLSDKLLAEQDLLLGLMMAAETARTSWIAQSMAIYCRSWCGREGASESDEDLWFDASESALRNGLNDLIAVRKS